MPLYWVRLFNQYLTHRKVASALVAVNSCDVLAHNKWLFGISLVIWQGQSKAQTSSVIVTRNRMVGDFCAWGPWTYYVLKYFGRFNPLHLYPRHTHYSWPPPPLYAVCQKNGRFFHRTLEDLQCISRRLGAENDFVSVNSGECAYAN